MLKIIPLGGLGEIGLNMMVFEYGETIFILDAGLMFPEDYMLGVDLVIPNMNYLKQSSARPMPTKTTSVPCRTCSGRSKPRYSGRRLHWVWCAIIWKN
jgi:hypothetical protein